MEITAATASRLSADVIAAVQTALASAEVAESLSPEAAERARAAWAQADVRVPFTASAVEGAQANASINANTIMRNDKAPIAQRVVTVLGGAIADGVLDPQ